MMTVRDPGWGWSQLQIDNFYMRWREWMLAAATRDAVVVANPSHQGFMDDLLERLKDDPWWLLQTTLGKNVIMMFDDRVPYDDFMFSVGTGGGLLTPRELIGPKGFGRLNAKAPSKNGVVPWSEAKPDADAKPITPD